MDSVFGRPGAASPLGCHILGKRTGGGWAGVGRCGESQCCSPCLGLRPLQYTPTVAEKIKYRSKAKREGGDRSNRCHSVLNWEQVESSAKSKVKKKPELVPSLPEQSTKWGALWGGKGSRSPGRTGLSQLKGLVLQGHMAKVSCHLPVPDHTPSCSCQAEPSCSVVQGTALTLYDELTRHCRFCFLLPELSASELKETHFMDLVPKLWGVFQHIFLPLSST